METTQVIGFAGTYYTLWTLCVEKAYYTAPNGKHYPSHMIYHYSYIKNISTDIEKAKCLYPNTIIDEELKGKTQSFSWEKKDNDLTPEILKFGKYAGCDVRELVKIDFDYILYMINQYGYNKTWEIAKQTPEYIKHISDQQMILDKKIASFKPLVSGNYKLTIERNPDEDGNVCISIIDGQTLQLQFNDIKECYYNGITYYLPVFSDGKAKRLKNKEFEYKLEIIETDINTEHGYCYQVAKVLN